MAACWAVETRRLLLVVIRVWGGALNSDSSVTIYDGISAGQRWERGCSCGEGCCGQSKARRVQG